MSNWILPDTNILRKSDPYDETEQMESAWKEADIIREKMDQMGARIEVEDIKIGPQIISYYCVVAEGVRVREVTKFADDLAYELGCESIRVNAPQMGSKFVVIEVPNKSRQTIFTGDVISSAHAPLEFPLGVDPSNCVIGQDIRQAPHILIAGQTGAGKSIALHNMICSLLMKTTPADLLLHLTDTKQTELTYYNGIPNLLCDCVTDAYEAVDHFSALVSTMEKRYDIAQEYGAKDLYELNEKLGKPLPYILVVVDEIADLIYISKHQVEEAIVRIAQKARAVGMHLVLATQSPRREIITGILKANLTSRMAFSTASELDSRIIIDKNGAGALIGLGDCLFSSNGTGLQRVQSPYISTNEISRIVEFWRNQQSQTTEIAA